MEERVEFTDEMNTLDVKQSSHADMKSERSRDSCEHSSDEW